MTVRMGQLMHVYPDQYDEYERRHNNLFPEMRKALKEAGAHNYSIFLDKKTGNLFAYLEVDNIEKYNAIAGSAACKKWWAYMEPIMDTNADQSPVTLNLHEVFHLD
ncbi:MAG: L-rhamnose mutarotase [Liquorilactobacillus nagelii]|jgi:L-rhamnose mutarotase|uniref:L-rhamnose mutarotase n=1 Tax=Liquorilactobacillus nagelii TaxID=82688 RepID=A0A3S6QXA0_9LACO|nr:L-rhamnose mutarotase [Liquorilactobacillus nagelii]AUJ32782.1 L-rhamnose mutarotase [Liquorilactobacillus nagelii]MCC7617007.1 L-rhamnose mutarotase [Liquorilactobacillus nagelii]MCI1634076.1 L-rhamnose mutarotase [Liquorilactobacillus nagelii]MCI1922336.1 L-rhamnose mutarotase [Liquorilactobacillus nagelii]MCI1977778.1 L-rhamnose mutarotase [Liquorilactobacillus nagelii]